MIRALLASQIVFRPNIIDDQPLLGSLKLAFSNSLNAQTIVAVSSSSGRFCINLPRSTYDLTRARAICHEGERDLSAVVHEGTPRVPTALMLARHVLCGNPCLPLKGHYRKYQRHRIYGLRSSSFRDQPWWN